MYPTSGARHTVQLPRAGAGHAPKHRLGFRIALALLAGAVVAGAAIAGDRAPHEAATPVRDAVPDVATPAAAEVPARSLAPTTTHVRRTGQATLAYGSDPAQLLDVAWPTIDLESAAPAIVYVHSGGWAAGSRANVPDFLLAQRGRGWTVISIDYRLAPAHPYPAANFDVDRALRWVIAHADALDVDPDRIVLAGGSAGGHLATTAAAAPGRLRDPDLPAELATIAPRPIALIALVAPTDLTALLHAPGWGPQLTADYLACPSPDTCEPATLADASPIGHVTVDAPPALFLYGSDDTLVPADPHGSAIAAAWQRAGRRATVLTIAGTGHNLDHTSVDQTTIDRFLDHPDRAVDATAHATPATPPLLTP